MNDEWCGGVIARGYLLWRGAGGNYAGNLNKVPNLVKVACEEIASCLAMTGR
jgi:hypothetical protein